MPRLETVCLGEKLLPSARRLMVKLVRSGASVRSVAKRFGVSLSHVQFWVARAQGKRLDRVDWADATTGPKPAEKGPHSSVEIAIVEARKALSESILGEHGAKAIRDRLMMTHPELAPLPSVRTIGRILARRGQLDRKARVRRPPPQRGWYLPVLAAKQAELDSFDIVEGLVIKGGTDVEVLNAISLHGGLIGSWPQGTFTSPEVIESLIAHWQPHGLPSYVQFDNAPLFQGPITYADTLGRVVRFCLQLGVTPVFSPPRETGFQAAIESYNARWQTQVWQR